MKLRMKTNGALVKQLVREVIVCTDKHVDHNLGEIVV
ncbi:hypothetical protein JBW_02144 [Pelosinus fermentans JBW45]|uniref:Uncharacterized protein n=1 Tax=Pelosinus fermentans JBW45 TaxID=1192197 RepID=I9DMB5_9FIRM|nr:hypothetical protein JBW_02144 [Pelosinus fermentans JBW45]